VPSTFQSILPSLIGAGAGLTSAVLQNQQSGQANQNLQQQSQMMYQLAQQEQARRDALTRAFLPSVGAGLGMRNPTQWAQQAYPTSLPTGGQYNFAGNPQAVQQPAGGGIGSTLAKSAIGTGVGLAANAAIGGLTGTGSAAGSALGSLASAIPGGAATLGIGAAIPIVAAIWKSTQAHPVANDLVQTIQNPFHMQVLKPIVDQVNSGQMTPAQGLSQLQQAWQQFQVEANNFASQGSKQRLVVGQMMDPSKTFMQTVNQVMADMQKAASAGGAAA